MKINEKTGCTPSAMWYFYVSEEMNPPTNNRKKNKVSNQIEYKVKIQELADFSARYVWASGVTEKEAAVAAVNWAQDNRAYGWDGEVTVNGESFQISRLASGVSVIE
jgi:hypothetical protein